MRIKKFSIITLVLVLLLSTNVSADPNINLADALVGNTINKSQQIKAYNITNDKLWKSYTKTYETVGEINYYIDLYQKENKSYNEQLELNMLVSIYGDYNNPDVKSNLIITRDILPLNTIQLMEKNKQMIEYIKDTTRLNIDSYLINLDKTNDSIIIQDSLVKSLQSNLNIARVKLKNGAISSNEYDNLASKLKISEIELVNLKLQKEITIQNIIKFTGLKSEELATAKSIVQIKLSEKMPLEFYTSNALNNRLDIKNAKRNYETRSKEFEIYKSIYKADNHPKVNNAYFEFKSAKFNYDNLTIDINTEISNAYKEYESKLLNFNKAEQLNDIEKYRYNEVKKKYELGILAVQDYSTASIELSKRQIQYINALRDAHISQLKLRQLSKLN